MALNLVHSLKVENILGEGVLWHPRQGSLWWTDISACRLYCYEPGTDRLDSWQTPERLSAFGFIEPKKAKAGTAAEGTTPQTLIAAFDKGFALYTPASGEYHWLAQPELHLPRNRFNDGRVDRQGRFWAGTMVEDGDPLAAGEAGSLYGYSGASGLQHQLKGIGISNGLCWSLDGRTAYLADSARRIYYAYDFDPPSGSFSNRRVFARAPAGVAPDGACVDAEDHVWNAHYGGGRVVCYAPDGDILRQLDLPVSQPTCVAFGGPELSWLCVTTAREGLSEAQLAREPEAGNLLIYQTQTRGLPPDFFQG